MPRVRPVHMQEIEDLKVGESTFVQPVTPSGNATAEKSFRTYIQGIWQRKTGKKVTIEKAYKITRTQ